MNEDNKHEESVSEPEESINLLNHDETDLDKMHVGCFVCHHWVPVKYTVAVVGKNDIRAHICLKHLKKSEITKPLHQAL